MQKNLNTRPEIDLVFLHGWGMNKGIWGAFINEFAAASDLNVRCLALDLLGYGDAPLDKAATHSLEDMACGVYQKLSRRSIVVGWSMGGLVAQVLTGSQFPLVIGQVHIASSPKFVESDKWSGIKPDVLQKFSEELLQDHKLLLKKFVALQCMGLKNRKAQIALIMSLIERFPLSDKGVLAGGLKLLQTADLRDQLSNSTIPCLRIFGNLDSLIPREVIPKIQELDPKSEVQIIEKAAHAPFVSHPQETINLINKFTGKLLSTT